MFKLSILVYDHREIKCDHDEKLTQNKKELKRIDWRIVKKILRLLYYNNKMKKTHIATRCNVSYDKCALYLQWIDIIDLLKREKDERGFELVSLNEKGAELFRRKFRDLAVTMEL